MRYTTQFPDGGGINLTQHLMAEKMKGITAPAGWTQHSPYHWSRTLNGKKLDFWPSKDKWMYDGKKWSGDVDDFIKLTQQSI